MTTVIDSKEAWTKDDSGQDDSGHATDEDEEVELDLKKEDEAEVKREIVWGNVVKFIILHTLALYGLTLLPSLSPPSNLLTQVVCPAALVGDLRVLRWANSCRRR